MPPSLLFLQDYEFLKFLPSKTAACCVAVALYCKDQPHWPAELEEACKWSWAELESCMRVLHVTYHRSPHSALTVIKGRYEKAERNGVANLAPPMNFDNMTWD